MEKFINCTNPLLMDPTICPGLMPPPGVMPMDPNAYSLRPWMTATTSVCASLTFIAVSIRIFTKAYVLKKMQMEDYCLVFAACGFGAFMGVMNEPFNYGCGKHQWNVSMADTMIVVRYVNLVQVLYSAPMLAAKLALLFQIQRIFFTVNVKNFTYWIVWFLIIANSASYTAFLFAFIFACVPREKIWNPTISGKCISVGPVMTASSALNLTSDIAILIVPLLSISSLQMPTRRKIAVSAIFATGILAIVASTMRLVYVLRLIASNDITYWVTPAGLWSDAEFTSVILCGCFPTFPPFLNFLRGRPKPGTSKYSYGSKPNSSQPPLPFSPKNSKHSRNSKNPYSWNDTIIEEEMGPYIPLDERTTVVGASNSEGADKDSQSSLRPGAITPMKEEGIYRTVEIETRSVNG